MVWREGDGEREGGCCFDDCGGAAGSRAHSGGSGEVDIGTIDEIGPQSRAPANMYTNANILASNCIPCDCFVTSSHPGQYVY